MEMSYENYKSIANKLERKNIYIMWAKGFSSGLMQRMYYSKVVHLKP